MAQVDPEWEMVPEAEALIVKLCDLYPDKIGHIDPKKIGCAMITNKDRPESQDTDSAIKGVGLPVSLFCQKQYVISFFKNVWDGYTAPQKSAMIMKNLLRVPEDLDGSLVKEDLKDIKCLVKRFGVDYMENPNLPDFASEKQVF